MVRHAAARAERAAVQSCHCIRVHQHILDLAVGRSQTAGRKPTSERVARPRAIHAIDREPWRANLLTAAARQTTLGSERDAHKRRPELAFERFESPPGRLVTAEFERELLGSDNRIHVPEQLANPGPDVLDVNNGRNACLARVAGGLRG